MKTVINLRILKEEGRYTFICLISCQLLKKDCALVAVDVFLVSSSTPLLVLIAFDRSY